MLSDSSILIAQRTGLISVRPFDKDYLNPASIDLTLHPLIMSVRDIAVTDPVDLKQSPFSYEMEKKALHAEDPYEIQPHEFILGAVYEYVTLSSQIAGRVEGKSSLARLGLMVHVTGGFIDPGFQGQVTLEIFNVSPRPIRLYPGMRVAQMAFHRVEGEVYRPYGQTGTYQYQSGGPTPSRYHGASEYGPELMSCWGCDWQGTWLDRDEQGASSRHCGACSDMERCCPNDHCLECGALT